VKLEGVVFLVIAGFFLLIATVYWFVSYEPAGTIMLFMTSGLGALPGAYLVWKARNHPPRLEDRTDATIAEGAGRIGSFPESSVWPLALAAGLSLVGLGFVFGIWMALPGGVLVLVAIIGAIQEGRRGPEPEYPGGEPEGP